MAPCRGWLDDWWVEASRHLTLPAEDLDAYRAALIDRFSNPRMHHRLDQIGADGSQKLPVRILPVLRLERATGREAKRQMRDMHPGEVAKTWADTALLHALTGYRPGTPIGPGIDAFVAWFRDHHRI